MVLSGGKRRAALLVFVLAAALGGCVASPQRPASTATHSLPAGHQWVRIESVGVEFAVAQSWAGATQQEVSGLPADAPELKALADRVGETPADLSQHLSAFDAELLAPPGGGASQNSVMVQAFPGTPLDIEHFETVAAGQDPRPTVARLSTPLGQGLQATSSSTTPSGEVHDWTINLDTPEGMTSFSILTRDEGSAQSGRSTRPRGRSRTTARAARDR